MIVHEFTILLFHAFLHEGERLPFPKNQHTAYSKGESDMPETIDQTNASVSQGQRDLIDQLLKPEVQESLTVLVDQLPKLTELVNILTKSYDFAQSVATDEVLKSDTVGALTEILE